MKIHGKEVIFPMIQYFKDEEEHTFGISLLLDINIAYCTIIDSEYNYSVSILSNMKKDIMYNFMNVSVKYYKNRMPQPTGIIMDKIKNGVLKPIFFESQDEVIWKLLIEEYDK